MIKSYHLNTFFRSGEANWYIILTLSTFCLNKTDQQQNLLAKLYMF